LLHCAAAFNNGEYMEGRQRASLFSVKRKQHQKESSDNELEDISNLVQVLGFGQP
jgi:hypothetical protein